MKAAKSEDCLKYVKSGRALVDQMCPADEII